MLGVPFCETLPHPASFLGFTVATVAVVIFISIIMSMVVIRWCLKLQRWVAIHVYAIPLVFRGHNRHCMRHRIPLPYSDRGAHLLLQKQVNSQACHQLCNMHFAVTGLPTVTEFQYFVKEMRPWVRKFFWILAQNTEIFGDFFHDYRVKILKFGEMLLKILKL